MGTSKSLAITAPSGGPPVLTNNMKNTMTVAAYDIFKKDAVALIWVEAVHDLETARSRVKELTAGSKVEYVIFDQRTRKIVPNFNAPITRL
jgi:hypothetical protein